MYMYNLSSYVFHSTKFFSGLIYQGGKTKYEGISKVTEINVESRYKLIQKPNEYMLFTLTARQLFVCASVYKPSTGAVQDPAYDPGCV